MNGDTRAVRPAVSLVVGGNYRVTRQGCFML